MSISITSKKQESETPQAQRETDDKYLLELESHVKHFEVLLATKDGNSYNEDSLPKLMKYTRGTKI